MMARNVPGIRQFPAILDILSMAQISWYDKPNWYPSLELIVTGLDLPAGVRDALLDLLRTSQELLEAGDRTAARDLLKVFLHLIRANSGVRLTAGQVHSLVAIAQTAIAGI
jgi:hypothetical protein